MAGSREVLRFPVREELRGLRLDQALVARMGGWSRTALQELIRSGAVRISGTVVRKPGLLLFEEGEIEVDLSPEEEAAVAAPAATLEVVFEDEHLVVLDKPAGLLTHRNSPRGEPGLADLALARFGPLPEAPDEEEDGPPRPGVVHRLDRETSGLIVLARTPAALAGLKEQFRARAVEKTYLALCHGEPRFDSDWIESPLGRSPRARDRISVLPEGEGRPASTYYETRERFGEVSLVAVFPKTGRMHQVRVHLASIDLPLVGDRVYRPRRAALPALPAGAPAIERHALHAHALALRHPATGEALRLESPLPADMRRLTDWLRARRRP